jgi:von Willebrand factor type A domain
VPLVLNQSQGVSSISLGPSGTTALSVQPDAAWAGKSIVVAGTHLGGAAPRLRLFRIDGGAPTSMCGSKPTFQCQSGVRTLVGNSILTLNGDFAMSVPVLPTTTEILLIASNSSSDGFSLFSAGFGTGQTGGLIIPRTPPRVFPRFPTRPSTFLLSAAERLITNTGVQLPPSSMTVRIPNCAKAAQGPTACTLPASSIQHLPISGGLNGLAVTLPADFFPAVPAGGVGSLGVQVDCTNLPTVSTTLEYSNRSPTQATTLVLDRSAAMDAANVAAMKVAMKALLQSLVPTAGSPASDKVSVISYADDADTLTGPALVDVTPSSIATLRTSVDSIATGGGTSIGDGVFEAQSLLANSFDDLTAANRPDRQAIVIINGSLNSQGALPEIYVD